MINNEEDVKKIKEKSFLHNGWFLPAFVELALKNIATEFLHPGILKNWVTTYPGLGEDNISPKLVGIVMAGNIPLAGFHDFLCTFITGHNMLIKSSSKDEVLLKHFTDKLTEWEPSLSRAIQYAEMLKGCDAYIATGSNNTAGYFDFYFGKYPHVIRRNRTSVSVLDGNETRKELEALADDVHLYFGMGCRNITKIYVPAAYDFELLIDEFKKYNYLADVHKYKNNYDYNLAIHVLNKKYYMSTEALLLVEDQNIFSPVSQVHYEFYDTIESVTGTLEHNQSIQCIVGRGYIPFGQAQRPSITQYADGIDTVQFLMSLSQR